MCPTNRFSAWSARRREMSDTTACQVTRNTRLWLTAGKTGFRRIDKRTDKTHKTRRVHGCGHTGNSENIFMREYLSGFILLKAINTTTTTMMKCVCVPKPSVSEFIKGRGGTSNNYVLFFLSFFYFFRCHRDLKCAFNSTFIDCLQFFLSTANCSFLRPE